MIGLLLAAVIFSANQGSAVEVTFPNETGIQSIDVIWEGKKVPAFRVNDAWMTIVGIDLDAKPGDHQADVSVTIQDERVNERDAVKKDAEKKYPTTELKDDERYVELSKANLARANRAYKETKEIYATVTHDLLPDGSFTVPIAGGTGT